MLRSVVKSKAAEARKMATGAIKRGVNREELALKVGDVHNNFELMSKEFFKDYDITLYKFKHVHLGTRHYHVDSEDTNNVFAFNFKTLPDDSTGKPHILEHITLCGSEKYPVRDPFFNMLKRSLNTFMNAWTGPDFTSYPFSTTNETDYYNLLSVYAESTFNPRLAKNDFLQEGWRLEFKDPEDRESGVEFKGVVYNEMKGVYENPSSIFMEKVQNNLLKGTVYEVDSGGDPEVIPDLTHEDLVQFHNENYNPSNSSIFTYGDLNPLRHQEFLEENYLKNFPATNPLTDLGQPEIKEPLRLVESKPMSAETIEQGKDTTFGISFLCQDINEEEDHSLGLSILSYLLFSTPKSPFYVDFLETGLASGYCAGVGFESVLRNSYFTVGFDNIEEGKSAEIEEKIFETLNRVAEEGFEDSMVEGALHMIETSSRIAKSNFGIMIFQNLLGGINHDNDDLIKSKLLVSENIDMLRERSQNGYFQQLVRTYLLENQKRVHVELNPDQDYMDKANQREAEKLQEIEKTLSETDKENIIIQARDLVVDQESIQDVDMLPTLTVEDIPVQEEKTEFELEEVEGQQVYFFDKPTNGVTHLRLKFDLESIDSSLINDLSLLERFFTQIGTKDHRYDDFSELVRLNMASLSFSVNYTSEVRDKDAMRGYAILKIACLDTKLDKAMGLLTELLASPDFGDKEHLSNLIRLESSNAANAFVNNALGFASSYGQASGIKSQQFYNSVLNVSTKLLNYLRITSFAISARTCRTSQPLITT